MYITIYIYIYIYTYIIYILCVWVQHMRMEAYRIVPKMRARNNKSNDDGPTAPEWPCIVFHQWNQFVSMRLFPNAEGSPLTNPGGFPPLTNPGGLPEMESSRCSHHNDSALASWQIILPAVSSECCHKTPCCGSFVVLVVWPILAPRGQGLHFRTTPWSLDSLVVISLSSSAWIPM